MKKTFQVNINDAVFHIDEDAYQMLNKYLNQLRQAFPGAEGEEIVADIEGRISELFAEIIASGRTVITLDDVNNVIEKMGRPSDLSDGNDSSETEEKSENTPDDSIKTPPPFQGISKKLYRNMQNKVFGGVLSGVACYFGWNANILRLLMVILALFTYVWPLIVAYLIAWMVIPAAVTPRQILEMKGAPVTVGNVGQTILGTADPNAPGNETSILGAFGKVVLIFFGCIAALIVLGVLVMFIKLLCGLILFWGWGSTSLLDGFDFARTLNPTIWGIGAICLAFAVALPFVAIVWATCAMVFKFKGISKPVLIAGAIIEVLLIIATTILLSVSHLSGNIEFISALTALPVACNC